PLFDVMLVLQNMEAEALEIDELKIEHVKFDNRTAKFDINLVAVETVGQLLLSAEYNTKLFNEETVRRFGDYFKEIVRAVLDNKEIKLKEITISHRLETIEATIPTEDFVF
ncbi:MAG: hypothetical protein GY757_42355, partial [bacterium]|nr:hypothetical protein [bacterium]